MKIPSTFLISTLLIRSAVATCWKGYHYCFDSLNYDEQQSARSSLSHPHPHQLKSHKSFSSTSSSNAHHPSSNPRHYLYKCLGNNNFDVVQYCESERCIPHWSSNDECKGVDKQREAVTGGRWEEELERDWEAYLGPEGVKELEGLFKMRGEDGDTGEP